jgi:hypothetical protein
MNSLSVSENITNSKTIIEKLNFQKMEIEKEILRMEGSLRVFEQMKTAGIETIQIKNKFDLDITEVDDGQAAI